MCDKVPYTDEYLAATYRGRVLCDKLNSGYCGSASRALHDEQMGNASSWVQSSQARWAYADRHGYPPDDWVRRAETAEAENATLKANLQALQVHIDSCSHGTPCCNCHRITADAVNGLYACSAGNGC